MSEGSSAAGDGRLLADPPAAKQVPKPGMELTRFRGHLKVRFGGVRDGRQECPIYTGV
jgi:hypothetical protein